MVGEGGEGYLLYVANVTTNDKREDGGRHNSVELISHGKRLPQGLSPLDKVRG